MMITTERLILREFILEDASAFYDLNLDDEVLKYTGDIPFKTIDEARSFIKNYNQYKKYGFGRWAVCLKENNQFIGFCGLRKNEASNDVDLGFRINRNFWNKGYATEASKACLDYGFNHLNLHNIVARAYVQNEASIKVLKKSGMHFVENISYDKRDAVLYQIKNDNSKTN